MNLSTKILKYSSKNVSSVVRMLENNKLVALPTETVYGLAGNAYSDKAVKEIYYVKNRPFSNPLIIHFKDIFDALKSIEIDSRAEKLAEEFWPGPMTLVAKIKNSLVSKYVNLNTNTIAIRVPSNKFFMKVIKSLEFPLAAPSANSFGKITPTCALDVKDELDKKIPAILDGGDSELGLESTVIDISTVNTFILRSGSIEQNKIREIVSINKRKSFKSIKSPGLSKNHYQPNKPLRINVRKPKEGDALLAFGKVPKDFIGPKLSLSKKKCLRETAKNLYKMLRIMDKKKSLSIAVEKIPSDGLGIAINERLIKAAYKEKI